MDTKEIKGSKFDFEKWSNKENELLIKSDKLIVLYYYIARTRLKAFSSIVLRASERQISTLIKVVETIKLFIPNLYQKTRIFSTNENTQSKSFSTIMTVELTNRFFPEDSFQRIYTDEKASAILECCHEVDIEGELNYTKEDVKALAELTTEFKMHDWIRIRKKKTPIHQDSFGFEPDLPRNAIKYHNKNKFIFFYKTLPEEHSTRLFLRGIALRSERNRIKDDPERGNSKKQRLSRFKNLIYPKTDKDRYLKEHETIFNKLSAKSKNAYDYKKRNYLYSDNNGLEKHKKVGCKYQYYDTDEKAIIKSFPIISPYFTNYNDDSELMKDVGSDSGKNSIIFVYLPRRVGYRKRIFTKPRYYHKRSFNKITFKNRLGEQRYYKGGFYKTSNTPVENYGSLQVEVVKNLTERVIERAKIVKTKYDIKHNRSKPEEYESGRIFWPSNDKREER